MVHDQLRLLLLEHDCVTLPGFGALLAEPVPARIHPVRHTLSPPARRVAFSDRLRHDDDLLTDAVRRSLPAADAATAPAVVQSFTESLRAALRQHRAAELRGLGTLRQPTAEEPIRFEALEPGYLPLVASFGLPELVSRPVVLAERTRATRYVPETAAANQQFRPGGPARLRRLVGEGNGFRLATAVLLVLGLSATYLNYQLTPIAGRFLPGAAVVSTQLPAKQRAGVSSAEPVAENAAVVNNASVEIPPDIALSDEELPNNTSALTADDFHKKALSPDALHSAATSPTPVAAPIVVKPAAEPVAKPVAASATAPTAAVPVAKPVTAATAALAATVRTAPTGRFYLVWNAFTTQAKAEKGRGQVEKLTPHGADNVPSVLTPPRGSALYRVAVADFATQAEAEAAKPALKARYGPALWVLRY